MRITTQKQLIPSVLGAVLISMLASGPALAVDATYTVPVPADLHDVATFPIKDLSYHNFAGKTRLEYTLPTELTGVPDQKISLQGRDGGYLSDLSGPNGTASCQPTGQDDSAGVTCQIHMKNLRFDSANLSRRLEQVSFTPEELSARMQVANLFRSDPVGVVIYKP